MITGTTGASAPFVCSAARDVPTQRFSSTSQRQVGRESRTDARLALLRQLTPRQIPPPDVALEGPVVRGPIRDRGLLGRLHSLDEHPNGAARGPAGGLYAFVVAKPHDSQLVRWNDHHLLAAHAGHEIHVLGRRPGTVAVYPEQSTV